MGCNARRLDLGCHAATADVRAGLARHGQDLVGDAADFGNVLRLRVRSRVARIQPIDIRQQYQRVGHDQLGDARSKPVVITVSNLVRGNRIVLVDDRDDIVVEQLFERAARIEETAPIFGVLGCQQYLCRSDIVTGQRVLPGVNQLHLACGCGSLQVL